MSTNYQNNTSNKMTFLVVCCEPKNENFFPFSSSKSCLTAAFNLFESLDVSHTSNKDEFGLGEVSMK